ncbi:Mog1p/PsbP-like protein [Guyanagaster necrorhizus]|uniref:Mog1p/PsbP-like protein n=1 Tax=Guyanagaster necrorhizus TaxID=856835 RepID=A0A9P7W4Y4_9AGAR|nr:Mog1p/PsbP-like protein [Guyanagaster necrorhizus MCA 3950]KAG7452702.1 Mog1p/PsbP-like protein [Guyanagaster necrorhizus MCA 3950]
MSSVRELFGGAVTAICPRNLIDASAIRQVPDTQEVFLYRDSGVSIIVEILQRVDPPDFRDAAKFHFDSLAHDNNALQSNVESVNVIPNDRGDRMPSAIVLSGHQAIRKCNQATPDQVLVLMAVYRMEEEGIDLVVTFNVPLQSNDGGGVGEAGRDTARTQFDTFVRSLTVVDFGLFA